MPLRRRLHTALLLALVFALAVSLAQLPGMRRAKAAPVPAVKPAAPAATGPLTRPDPGAARLTARATGKRVEVLSRRTDTTQVFANPDGSLTMTANARPVRVKRADGSWDPIDTDLAAGSDGTVRPKATSVDLGFSGGGTGPLVTVGYGGTTLTIDPPKVLGELPTPTLSGDTATYPDVLPGVDLKVTADGQGYSEVLVVKTAEAAANPALQELSFPTSVPGGQVTTDQAGTLQVFGKNKDKPVLVGAAPRMWDSSAAATDSAGKPRLGGSSKGPRTSKRRKQLTTSVTAGKVTVRPDAALLTGAATQYPVFIDPGVTVNRFLWSLLESDDPNTPYYNSSLPAVVGTYNSGATKFRSLFGMDTKPLNGTHIISANFRIHETDSWSCTATPFQLWDTSAIYSTTTWANYTDDTAHWKNLLGTQTTALGGGSSCPAGDVSFPITAHIQTAANSGWSGTSLGIRAPVANESNSTYYKEFDNSPVLDVTYNTVPTQPRGLTITDCYVNCTDPRKISATKPQFRTIVKDGDAGQRVQTEYRVRQGTTVIASGLSNSGTNGSWVAWTPSTALTNGQSYTVSVRGYDGVDYSPWSADATFSIDTTPPVAATVSSTDYPAGAWSKRADQAGNFTLGNNSDFAGFAYGLDQNPPTTEIRATSGAATISLTPDVDGPHTLYVRPRDAAGNYGPLTSYAFNVGQAAITTPVKGQQVTGFTSVQAVAPSTVSGYTLQWRRADTDTWVNVPTADVTLAAGGAVTWPQARVSGAFPKLTWNVAKTFNDAEPGPDPLDGPVQARVLLPGTSGDSAPLKFTLSQAADGAASASVGPGSVNLVSGNLAINYSDVSVDSYGSDLTVGRTFNTRKATTTDPTAMFGPGWTSTASVLAADSTYTGLTVVGTVVQVGTSGGSSIGFTVKSGGGYLPELGYEDLTLAKPDANTYTLADLDGNVTTFTLPSGSTAWKPTAVTVPGSAQTTTTSWETATVASTTVTRPTRILAPVPNGVTCGAGIAGLVKGCRALSFTYATITTATATTPGDYTGRVTQIAFTGWDPDLSTPAMRTVVLAKYAYDSNGRLASVWDPRLDNGSAHLATTYTYDADGILATITPVAEQPWQLSYTTVPGDTGKGRLKQVTRSALTAGTAKTTVVYKVPVSGAGAPYDLSASQTTRWGQAEPPAQATAVFSPDQVPDGDPAAGTMPSSWTRAQISYLDPSGRTVNTTAPGNYTDATWYDATNNAVRILTATNRARALNASTTDTATDEAALAERYTTRNLFEAGGRRLKETFGPEHDTAIPDGSGGWITQRARTHTVNTYDEGAPSGNTYDLVTTQVTGARLADGSDADTRTTTTGYDWNLRQPTSVTTDPAGLNLTARTAYDATTGLVTSTTAPAGGTTTNTPRTTQTVYYSAGTNTTNSECGSHAEWANLPCRVQAGGSPSAGQPIPVTTTTYDLFNQPRVSTEKTPSGTLLRTTTTAYDSAARPLTTDVAASAGTALPTTKTVYEASTGRAIRTQSLSGTTVTAEIVRGYDGLGRLTSYIDADGTTATTTYDLLSRPVTTSDGKGTQTLSYDDGAERRGLLTQVVDSQAGTFTASYDADGRMIAEGLPNTLTITTAYDETGDAVTQSTSEPGCTPTNDCIDLDEQVTQTAHGQWATHSTDLSGQEYAYDRAGRLTKTRDYAEPVSGYAGCTTRSYGFDNATNRTSYTSYAPADGGDCQTATAATSKTWTYDTADRTTSTGYTYDALGRTSTVPSADTANSAGDLTVSYYTNDLVRALTQAGTTTTYALDVLPSRARSWGNGSTTNTNHYDSDSDAPSWTAAGSTYRRNIAGPDGALAAIYDSATGKTRIQITNLHGDILAIAASNLTTDPGILATFETDEYGNPRDSGDIGYVRYGYLGDHQRAADNPAGITLMGVRLYSPATGRFLQRDPLVGGSCNDYEYGCGDPVNQLDLDGRCICLPIQHALDRYITLQAKTLIYIYKGARWVYVNKRWIFIGAIAAFNPAAAAYWASKAGGKSSGGTGSSNSGRAPQMQPSQSPKWRGFRNFRGNRKYNGKDGRAREYYEWDYTHGDIEVYDYRGVHKGSMEPTTGKIYKPAVRGRRITL
ncbi:RHS repeat-associated core domain-containing protein [Cryptosporangium phraense]|uniref:Colicin E3-like ribonuclease domain-containing protein n=1 Tax=Cryptosporangium phraense TaxID=2593070 RepID=A0A545AN69_9ACTN|nr:RHS repeat-associated core domain-containing protein [Cryptosporangium phraense]TQS42778.1 hypothetical protein FL583_22200 [Cryptosporangium phraense]